MVSLRHVIPCFCLIALAACASRGTGTPYPAFVQADELPDVFLATLPGARGKQFAGDAYSRRSSNRVALPPDWSGTTGGAPDKSVELFVLAGRLRVGDLALEPGGYAYFPPGFHGTNVSTSGGAVVLYFLDNASPSARIGTPIIYGSEMGDWRPQGSAASGIVFMDLRHDPGSGARTYLLKVNPAATLGWQSWPAGLEGYLVSGRYRANECVAGRAITGVYEPGGYFFRPPQAVAGGPGEGALTTAVWLLRVQEHSKPQPVAGCAGGAQ